MSENKNNDGRIATFCRPIGKGYKEFCEHTPIHGVPYTGQGGRKAVERCLWVVIMVIATACCSFLIYNLYKKWENSPVLVDFKSEPVNVWEIPFPAVTICPDELILDPGNFDENDKCSIDVAQFLLRSICASGSRESIDIPTIDDGCSLEKLYPDAIQAIIPADAHKLFIWNETEINVDILLTDFGICFTFNLLDPAQIFKDEVLQDFIVIDQTTLNRTTNWKLARGYESSGSYYPFRAFDSGIKESFLTFLSSNSDEAMESCKTSENGGYSVILHSPIEYPSSAREAFIGPYDSSFLLYVKPKAIYADENVESLSIETRRCFFEHESRLKFFRAYTESNCEIECLTNYTYLECGCVPLNLPRTKDMRVCKTNEEFNCTRLAPQQLLSINFQNRDKGSTCNCLPNCNGIVYEAEAIHSSFTGTSFDGFAPEGSKSGLILVYFQETQFWPSTRSRLYHVMDFLADCGGLMGLCMGVSFVSLIEILYHCTLRHIPRKKGKYDLNDINNDEEAVELKSL